MATHSVLKWLHTLHRGAWRKIQTGTNTLMSAPSPTRHDGFVPGRHGIDAFGAGGFRFAGMSHKGSILALPSGIHKWDAALPGDISVASLAALFAEPRGAVDLLLLGTGTELAPQPDALRWQLRDAGVRLEVMQTSAAARTYNILLNENRRVAAALLAVD